MVHAAYYSYFYKEYGRLIVIPLLCCWCRASSTLEAGKSSSSSGDNGQNVALEYVSRAKEEARRLQHDSNHEDNASGSSSSSSGEQVYLAQSDIAELCVKTLEKMSEKGTAYLADEHARIDSLLSRGIAESKRPLFYGKILCFFFTSYKLSPL
jgi:hypothetical protein